VDDESSSKFFVFDVGIKGVCGTLWEVKHTTGKWAYNDK